MSAAEKAIEAGSGLIDKWGERLAEVVAQYGPDAADLALALGRVGAVKELAVGFAAAAAAIVLCRATSRLLAKAREVADEPEIIFIGLGIALSAIAGAFSTILSLAKLTNAYAWAGMFHPEIYLAAEALGW